LILRSKVHVLAIIWLFRLRSAYPFPSICIPMLPTIQVKTVYICHCEVCTDDNSLNNHTCFYTHYKLKSCHFVRLVGCQLWHSSLRLTHLFVRNAFVKWSLYKGNNTSPPLLRKETSMCDKFPPLPPNVKIYCILGESGQYTSEKSRMVTSFITKW